MRRGLPKLKQYGLHAFGDRRPGSKIVTSTGHLLATDLPKKAGGQDTAPQPVELLLAGLLGCKTATAHYVARHIWPRPHHTVTSIEFVDVVAERDERGALTLPMSEDAPVTAALLRVSGRAIVHPTSASITQSDVARLGALVEKRCPVAATLHQAGCTLDFEWVLNIDGESAERKSDEHRIRDA
jgi:uncharacterized OsmC-like protein